jgi:hypothetical protein
MMVQVFAYGGQCIEFQVSLAQGQLMGEKCHGLAKFISWPAFRIILPRPTTVSPLLMSYPMAVLWQGQEGQEWMLDVFWHDLKGLGVVTGWALWVSFWCLLSLGR